MKKFISILYMFALMLPQGFLYSQIVSTIVPGPSTFDDGLCRDSFGNIYASKYEGNTVTKITPSGQTSIFVNGISTPNGTAIGPDGKLYLPSNVSNGIVIKVLPSGVQEPFITSIPFPTTVLFRADRKMYISCFQLDKIYLADSLGDYSELYSGNGMNGPVGLTQDNNGNLIISNFNDGKIFSVSQTGVFTQITQIPGIVGYIEFVDGFIYATGFSTHKIYKISLSGQTTVLAGTGLPGQTNGIASVATFNAPNGIVASKGGDSLFISDFNANSLRLITGVSTGIINVSSELPSDFILGQNYPNPFNPVTKINFSVPSSSKVTLKIYNNMGQEVETLVNGKLSAGSYQVDWNAINFNSGAYYYKIQAEGFIETKKMLLIK